MCDLRDPSFEASSFGDTSGTERTERAGKQHYASRNRRRPEHGGCHIHPTLPLHGKGSPAARPGVCPPGAWRRTRGPSSTPVLSSRSTLVLSKNCREGPNSRGGFPPSRQTDLSQKRKRPMGGERRRRMQQRHHLDPLVALGTAQSPRHFPSRTRGPIHAPRLLQRPPKRHPAGSCPPLRTAGPPSPPFPSISPLGTRAAGPTPTVRRLRHEQ